MSDAKGKTMENKAPERICVEYNYSATPTVISEYPDTILGTMEYVRKDLSAPQITEEMVERAVAAALPELQRREAVMADPMTLDRMQARRIVRAALTAALATQEKADG